VLLAQCAQRTLESDGERGRCRSPTRRVRSGVFATEPIVEALGDNVGLRPLCRVVRNEVIDRVAALLVLLTDELGQQRALPDAHAADEDEITGTRLGTGTHASR
jgi:hypothetical protein